MSNLDPLGDSSEAMRLRRTLDDLAEAHRRIDELRRRADEAAELAKLIQGEAHHALRLYGSPFIRDEEGPPRDVIRFLYWDCPKIHAQEIARAFGIHGGGGKVHEFAGSDGITPVTCRDCGKTRTREHRTEGSEYVCGDCWDRRGERNEAMADEWKRKREAENAQLERAINEGSAEFRTTRYEITYNGIRRTVDTENPQDGDW